MILINLCYLQIYHCIFVNIGFIKNIDFIKYIKNIISNSGPILKIIKNKIDKQISQK